MQLDVHPQPTPELIQGPGFLPNRRGKQVPVVRRW